MSQMLYCWRCRFEIPMLDEKGGNVRHLEPMRFNEQGTAETQKRPKRSFCSDTLRSLASKKPTPMRFGTTNLANTGHRAAIAGSPCAHRELGCAQHAGPRSYDLLL